MKVLSNNSIRLGRNHNVQRLEVARIGDSVAVVVEGLIRWRKTWKIS